MSAGEASHAISRKIVDKRRCDNILYEKRFYRLALHGASGLKWRKAYCRTDLESLTPHGVCGLKLHCRITLEVLSESHLAWGEWIEITVPLA